MILQELIKNCTQDDCLEIGRRWAARRNSWEKPVSAERIAARLAEFCTMLAGLTPAPVKEPDVLCAMPYYEDGECSIYAELFQKNDFEEKVKKQGNKDVPKWTETSSCEELKEVLELTYERIPQAYGYTEVPWEETLGAEVFPENYEVYGRIDFLSSVLFEMSFNGFTKEVQAKRHAELEKAIAEAEEIQAMPEEERKQYQHELIEVEQISRKTEAEKMENMRKALLDGVRTREGWIKVLQSFANRRQNIRKEQEIY